MSDRYVCKWHLYVNGTLITRCSAICWKTLSWEQKMCVWVLIFFLTLKKKSFFLSNCVYNCIFPSKIILFAHMLTSIRYRVSAQLQIDANWNFFIVSKCNLNVLTFICTKRPSGRVTFNYEQIEFRNIQFHAENDSVFLKFCWIFYHPISIQ